jgi:hypothetical protein
MLSVERVWNRRLLADPSLRQPFQRKLKSARAS